MSQPYVKYRGEQQTPFKDHVKVIKSRTARVAFVRALLGWTRAEAEEYVAQIEQEESPLVEEHHEPNEV